MQRGEKKKAGKKNLITFYAAGGTAGLLVLKNITLFCFAVTGRRSVTPDGAAMV